MFNWSINRVVIIIIIIEHYTVEFFFDDSIRSKNISKH